MENKYYVKDLGKGGMLKCLCWMGIYYVYIKVWLFFMTINDSDSVYIVGGVLLLISLLYLYIQAKKNGLYIEGDSIYYKDIIRIKINPEKIKGIKITKDTMLKTNKGFWGATYSVPRVDENGNYVYCMIFLKELYDDMQTYNRDHECFSTEYHECIMFKTVYDLPAINRLREMIPDLVVMYEE